jgi:hypothetical protein
VLDGPHALLGTRGFPAPWIADLPVGSTLWTLRAPPSVERLTPLLTHTLVSPAQQERMRLESVRQMLESTADVAGRSAPGEIDLWRSELHRWEQVHQQRLASGPTPRNRPLDAHLPTGPADLADSWLADANRGSVVYGAMRGEAPTFLVRFENGWLRRLTRVATCVAAVTLLLLLALLARHCAFCREWLVRFPHAAGLVAGLLLWWLLAPGAIGLIVAAVFLLGSLRPRWDVADRLGSG